MSYIPGRILETGKAAPEHRGKTPGAAPGTRGSIRSSYHTHGAETMSTGTHESAGRELEVTGEAQGSAYTLAVHQQAVEHYGAGMRGKRLAERVYRVMPAGSHPAALWALSSAGTLRRQAITRMALTETAYPCTRAALAGILRQWRALPRVRTGRRFPWERIGLNAAPVSR